MQEPEGQQNNVNWDYTDKPKVQPDGGFDFYWAG